MEHLNVLYFGTSAYIADLEKEGAKQLSIFKAKSSRTYRILGPKPIYIIHPYKSQAQRGTHKQY